MDKQQVLKDIYHKLIVSCQARKGWAMHGSDIMAAFAAAAQEGGAGGIRANGPEDILAIKRKVSLPMIGINKQWQEGYAVYITPTYESAIPVIEAGAEIIALDATPRPRPKGETLESIIKRIRQKYPNVLIMGEISILDEAKRIINMGIDLISTTLSGYTAESANVKSVNLQMVRDITALTPIPVIAEGKIQSIEEAVAVFEAGAHAVVVGTSITRPEIITSRYVQGINAYFEKMTE
ncbi:MAG: hypothetical protein APF77_23605 [Clostridia bacterium BRH_c25]|nr:MAG: hypothetical protein APF77_23605 [Clostridia bacterium BRH_c25]